MAARAYLAQPTPFAIAHRGGAGELPENTIPAFDRAVALGYRHIETDAHVSSDGEVFAFHDDVLDHLTDRRGALSDVPAATIAGADAAFAFNAEHGFPHRSAGFRVPSMREILTRWPEVFVNIDTKSDAVVEPLVRLLTEVGATERVCVGSFSDARIRRVRELTRGAVCTSMGPRALATAWLASRTGRMPALGADCLQVPPRWGRMALVDQRLVRAAHAARLQVHVWTVDAVSEMQRLLDLGVDAVMTDLPAVLRDVLRGRGQWHGGPGTDA
jgi:glycerophosphoryl diester phosphodiesterase